MLFYMGWAGVIPDTATLEQRQKRATYTKIPREGAFCVLGGWNQQGEGLRSSRRPTWSGRKW